MSWLNTIRSMIEKEKNPASNLANPYSVPEPHFSIIKRPLKMLIKETFFYKSQVENLFQILNMYTLYYDIQAGTEKVNRDIYIAFFYLGIKAINKIFNLFPRILLVDQKMILFSKYLNPMILPVSDENVPGRVDRNALQPLELAIVLAPPAE